MAQELHAVFATNGEHKVYRVSDPLSWDEAQREWTRLDDLRRAGLLPQTKHFEVRSVTLGPDRPLSGPEVRSHGRYDGVPMSSTLTKPVASKRGFAWAGDAAKVAWRLHFGTTFKPRRDSYARGEQGFGGWYYWPNGVVAAQGKSHLAEVCVRRLMVVQGVNGRWFPLAVETL